MTWSISLLAQNDYARAERLFNEAKFDSASQLYLDLFNTESPKNPSTYLALSRSLFEVKDFDRLGLVAEKYRIDSEDPLGYIDQYWARESPASIHFTHSLLRGRATTSMSGNAAQSPTRCILHTVP